MKRKLMEFINFYDEKKATLQRIVERLEEEAEEHRKYWREFGDEDSFGGMNACFKAIEIVREEGGLNG